jgi:hypothetical protein
MRGFPQAMMVAAILALAGCGSREDAQPAGEAASGTSSGSTAISQGDDSVAAVLQSQGTPLATVRFTLPEKPVAGRSFPLQLAVTSSQGGASLRLSLESEGLQVSPPSAELDFSPSNTTRTQDLTLTATEAGIMDLTVRLTGGEGAAETVYVIPVMVEAAGS